jgi:CheY-like chemotaxis protein
MAHTGSGGAAHPPDDPTRGPDGLHILLVEDDPFTAETTATLLGLSGHDVRVSADGPSALAAALDEPPEVVLLDIGLPGMDGYEVAKRLRQQPRQRRPLLIALTGRGRDADERLNSYQAGIDLHLTKPVSPEELLGFLRHYQEVTAPPAR